jgi:hypothetical protein
VAVCVAKEKVVSAVVQLHPGAVEASDYAQVAMPISVLAASSDGVQQHEALLALHSNLPSFVKVFAGGKNVDFSAEQIAAEV